MRIMLAFLLLFPSLAWAQNYTYNTPGTYVLPADSTSTGQFNIKITASNVTLDLGGRTVTCNPADPLTASTFGIQFSTLNNIVIRNGRITGCRFGILGSYSTNVQIINVDFTGNRYVGVSLGGSGNLIRGNSFAEIGGYSLSAYAIGVNNAGADTLIEGNVFHNLYRQTEAAPELGGEGVAVIVSPGNTNVIIRGNSFANDEPLQEKNLGVWVGVDASAVIERNLFLNFDWAIGACCATVSFNTFWLQEGPGHWAVDVTEGSANDNLVVGWDDPWNGNVVDAGGNVVILPDPPLSE
jgi:hypothetical protein